MKPVDFELHRPATTGEAVALLAEHAPEAKVLAGGQSLLPLLNFRLARPEHLVDLGRIASLAELRRTRDALVVGAMVRQSRAERSPAVAADAPLLAAAFPHIAHPPVRNRGTVGGSLAHGDPAAELPAVARALDAVFVAAGPGGRREIAARDFFQANLMTALDAGELLVEIRFPRAAPGTGASFQEVARRNGDFALVGVAAQVTVRDGVIGDARVCVTGVGPTPYRAAAAEEALTGRAPTEARLAEAADALRAAIEPSGDLHATAGYRRDVAGTLAARAVAEAHRRATAAAPTRLDDGDVAGHPAR
ncbi:xanthine dehydrogenase family protein subunit M [Actinomadura sp. KC345]|uniref:FAD binding domain-containing protein n=1 Tax=Actinomadura sp. KC345 TaxID=2530371 RepID=UPI00104E2E5E|nr:xanthine dehydrogenase family protein subunit M [Actinomadura sp. KC345]TDC46162.1 xanthine dehydrogenase family protein subunit M [Actinomadura sp. KC345]